jgi:hypothetical protein
MKRLLENRWLGVLGAFLLLGALCLVAAAIAFAAEQETSATLSTGSSLPTQVDIGSNSFQIKVWATGTLPSGKTGEATVVKKYSMATDGTITASASPTDVQSLSFTTNYNYSASACISSTPDSSQPQGCQANPFVVNATLDVAAGTPDGTLGTLSVSNTGSAGLTKDGSPAQGYVKVNAPVTNAPPTVLTPAGDANGIEGETLETSGAFSDPDGDPLTLTADNTQGTFIDNGDGTWSWSLPTTDDVASHTVTVAADDGNSHTAEDRFDYSAENADPSIESLNLSASNCEPTLSFDVSDPGSADTESGTIKWGDESTGSSFAGQEVPYEFSQSHHYSSAGTYTIQVDVSDDDGGKASGSPLTQTVHNIPSGVLQPVNANGSSIFKLGSTIPVKITVADCDGSSVSSLAPQVSVVKLTEGLEGTVVETTSTANPTSGTTMRYDATTAQYIYNLATKPLTAGTWRVKIHDGSFAEDVKADFSLKK